MSVDTGVKFGTRTSNMGPFPIGSDTYTSWNTVYRQGTNWTNQTNAGDGDTGTSASCSTAGSFTADYLFFRLLGSGGTLDDINQIYGVYWRVYGSVASGTRDVHVQWCDADGNSVDTRTDTVVTLTTTAGWTSWQPVEWHPNRKYWTIDDFVGSISNTGGPRLWLDSGSASTVSINSFEIHIVHDRGDSIYVVGHDGSEGTIVTKSTNQGTSFSEVDAANAPSAATTSHDAVAAFFRNALMHIAVLEDHTAPVGMTAGGSTVKYHRLITDQHPSSSEGWDITDSTVDTPVWADNNPGNATIGISFAPSTVTPHVTVMSQGDNEADMGTSYTRAAVWYATLDEASTSVTWSGPYVFDRSDAVAGVNYDAKTIDLLMGGSTTQSNLMTFNGTATSHYAQAFYPPGATKRSGAELQWDATNQYNDIRTIPIWYGGTPTEQNVVVGGSYHAKLSWNGTALSEVDTEVAISGLPTNPGFAVALAWDAVNDDLWIAGQGSSDADLYYNGPIANGENANHGTTTELINNVTASEMGAGWCFYETAGGDYVLGLVWQDAGSTVYYDTHVITAGGGDQTLTASLFSVTPTFPSARLDMEIKGALLSVSPTIYTAEIKESQEIAGPLLSVTTTFPQAQLDLEVLAPLHTVTPTFPAARLDQQVQAPLLSITATFPQAQLDLELVPALYTVTTTFPTAQLDQTIEAGLFSPPVTIYAGVLGQEIVANLFSVAPTFGTGLLYQSDVKGALHSVTPTFPAARIDQEVRGPLVTVTPTFPQGSLDLAITPALFSVGASFPQARIDQTILPGLFSPSVTFPQASIATEGAPQNLTANLFSVSTTTFVSRLDIEIQGALLSVTPAFPTAQLDLEVLAPLFSPTVALPQASIATDSEPQTLTASLFSPTVTMFGGRLDQTVEAPLLTVTPSFGTATIYQSDVKGPSFTVVPSYGGSAFGDPVAADIHIVNVNIYTATLVPDQFITPDLFSITVIFPTSLALTDTGPVTPNATDYDGILYEMAVSRGLTEDLDAQGCLQYLAGGGDWDTNEALNLLGATAGADLLLAIWQIAADAGPKADLNEITRRWAESGNF